MAEKAYVLSERDHRIVADMVLRSFSGRGFSEKPKARRRRNPGRGGKAKLFRTTSQISAATWDGTTLDLGSGTAKPLNETSTETEYEVGEEITIYQFVQSTTPTDTTVMCHLIDGRWVLGSEDCS